MYFVWLDMKYGNLFLILLWQKVLKNISTEYLPSELEVHSSTAHTTKSFMFTKFTIILPGFLLFKQHGSQETIWPSTGKPAIIMLTYLSFK